MNMKLVIGATIVLAIIYFFPALKHMQAGREISGDTTMEVKKSAMTVRRTMSTSDRNSFDMAFGILEKLKSQEGPDAFPKAVDGLEPQQVVELAKQEVNAQIAAGSADFKRYASWDDMLTKLDAEAPKNVTHAVTAPLRQSDRPGRPD
jgi:hypothetical protein